MAKIMKGAAAISFLLTFLFAGLHFTGYRWALPYAITFGTCFYHFAMRLLVGYLLNEKMQNRANYGKPRYQLHPLEVKLYKRLKVKQWKGRMPTYDPKAFDPKYHTWDEIAQATCQAETVHEVLILLSFLPLLAAIPFGSFGVFLLTSLAAALYDLTFVIMQRYNRPRIIRLIEKERTVK